MTSDIFPIDGNETRLEKKKKNVFRFSLSSNKLRRMPFFGLFGKKKEAPKAEAGR